MSKPKKIKKRVFVICPNPSIDILATIENIRANKSNRILSEKRYPGGKGIHVALALGEMGIPTTLIGLWGDENGKWLMEACKKYCPNLEVIGPQIKGWNRSCYTFQSDTDWKDTEILGTGPVINQNHFDELTDLLISRKDEMEFLAISGSWPMGAKPEYNQKLVELGDSINIPVFLDCTGIQLENALNSRPFCVHLNKREITENIEENFEMAKSKITLFCNIAAITDGAKGLFLCSGQKEIHANVVIDNVKSAVGSGDCLMAGIIAACHFGLTFQNIAKLGVAYAAANCVNEDLGMLRKDDVDELFFKVTSKVLRS